MQSLDCRLGCVQCRSSQPIDLCFDLSQEEELVAAIERKYSFGRVDMKNPIGDFRTQVILVPLEYPSSTPGEPLANPWMVGMKKSIRRYCCVHMIL